MTAYTEGYCARSLSAEMVTEGGLRTYYQGEPVVGQPGDSPIVARMRLGLQLKALRRAAGVTGERAGAAIGSSGSKISRAESGLMPVRERDVEKLVALYGGVTAEDRQELLRLARESNGHGWWDAHSDTVPAHLRHCLEREAAACLVATFDHAAIPTLLHTDLYALAAATTVGLEAPEWRGGLDLRTLARRRELLLSPRAPRLWAVIGANALMHGPRPQELMAGQITHLIKAAGLPHVTLQILPAWSQLNVAAGGPFSMLRFNAGDLPDLAMLELMTGITCMERRRDVDRHWRVFHLLAVNALTPDDSLRALNELADGRQDKHPRGWPVIH